MRLTVVGCSGSVPGPESAASCYLVQADGFTLVVDMGSGSLGPLQRHIRLAEIDAIALSHLHPDHYLDLCPYFVARRYDPDGGYRPVSVHGPTPTAERVAAAYDTAVEQIEVELDVRPWQPSQLIGPFHVSAERVDHPGESYGLRIEHAGRVLTYSGDTDECDALIDLARDCDLFLCEAGFLAGRDADRHVHLTPGRAGRVATSASARRLLVTHIPPWSEVGQVVAQVRATYTGALEVARPGSAYDV